jgi:hypothetical protein
VFCFGGSDKLRIAITQLEKLQIYVTCDIYTSLDFEFLLSTFFSGEEPRSRRYGRTVALRLIVQPCDEDDDDDDYYYYFLSFS